MNSILLQPMKCDNCGYLCCAFECEPDCDGDGSLGCPLDDCGGIMTEFDREGEIGVK